MNSFFRMFIKKAGFDEVYTHHFYKNGLDENSTIIDLGANIGSFSKKIREVYNCKCLMVEPSPREFSKIQIIDKKKEFKFNYCITKEEGEIDFNISENPESNSLNNDISSSENKVKVKGIKFEKFIDELKIDKIDLLKIDIEGEEINLLKDINKSRLKTISQITVEFHDFKYPSQTPEILLIHQKMSEMGFSTIIFTYPYNHVDVLYINRNEIKLSLSERFYKFIFYKLLFTLRYFRF